MEGGNGVTQLKMPRKGESALMLAELQAEHASGTVVSIADDKNDETHVTTLQATHDTTSERSPVSTPVTSHAATNVTDNERATPETGRRQRARRPRSSSPADQPAVPDRPAHEQPRESSTSQRDERYATALRRAAEDEVAVVTVRVSAALNRYMDDYTARINRLDPRRKYRKQDAVMEAFAAFYADHPMPPAPETEDL
jgi:hypothetical protein